MVLMLLSLALLGCDTEVADTDDSGGGGNRDSSDVDDSGALTDSGATTDSGETDPPPPCATISDPIVIDASVGPFEVEPTPTGFAHDLTAGTVSVAPMVVLRDGGAGSASWQPVAGPSEQAPGTLEVADATFSAAAGGQPSQVTVNGDLHLRVAGDLRLGAEDRLVVTGTLLLDVAGALELSGAVLYAGEALVVHHSGTSPAHFADADGLGTYAGGLNSGSPFLGASLEQTASMSLFSRAGFVFGDNSYVLTGTPRAAVATAASGPVLLRTYGDVVLGESTYVGPSEANAGSAGALEVFAEGEVSLGESAYLGQGESAAGAGRMAVHAVAGVSTADGSYLYTTHGAGVDLRSEGEIALFGSIFPFQAASVAGGDVVIRGERLVLGDRAYVAAGTGDGTRGGALRIDVARDVVVGDVGNNVGVFGGEGLCSNAGDVVIHAGTDVSVRGGQVRGGFARIVNDCVGGASGIVNIEAGGIVSVEAGSGQLLDGAGDVLDPAAFPQGAPVLPAPVDHEVWRWGSLAVPGTQTCRTPLVSVDITDAVGDVQVQVRQPGTHWVDAATLVGTELAEGFEVRLALKQRAFDGASAAGATLTFQ